MKSICKILAVIVVYGLLFTACDSPSESVPKKTVANIAVTTNPTRIHYTLNDMSLDLTGMVVTAYYNDGTADTVTGYTCSGFNTDTSGNKEITVSYGGKTTSFSITVDNPVLAAMPVATPVAEQVVSGATVTLSSGTEGAEIWYTVDGNTPAKNGAGSARYTSPITITTNVTIKAIAVKDGMSDSEMLTAAYTVAAASTVTMPVANPPDGSYVISGETVSLSAFTAGSEIWYTVDGSTPAKNGAGSARYTSPITITTNVTIKAIAVKDGMSGSEMLTAAYTVEYGYAPVAPDSVPDDWQNDLWLQYEFRELRVGDTAEIYPRRIPEAVFDLINNDIYYPNFNYEIVQGSGVVSIEPKIIEAKYTSFGSVSNPGATHKLAVVTALKTGVAIIKVTYDEYTHPKGTVFGASSAINAAYAAYSVTDGTSAGITIGVEPPSTDPLVSRLGTGLRHPYDTVYFIGSGVSFPINPTVTGANTVAVTCNGALVQKSGGLYNLPLKNTQNIIGVKATNANGQSRYYYEMINARKIEVITSPTPTAGQEFTVSFKGLTMPVPKMAGIYNPSLGISTTVNYTSNPGGGTHQGGKTQWYFAEPNNNSFNVTFPSAGTYTFTDGFIKESWFGYPLGYEKTNRTTGSYQGNAPTIQDSFMLPDFTLRVRAP